MKGIRARRLVGWVVSTLLAACGGGGSDGSSGGGGGGGGGGNGATLSLSTSSLDFTTFGLSSTPPSQLVSATINGTVSAPVVYIRVVVNGAAVSSVSSIGIAGNTGNGFVNPAPAQALGPGRHTATITVTACTSSIECNSGIIGTPQTVDVVYTVNAIQVSAQSLDYTLRLTSDTAAYTRSFTVLAYPAATLASNVPWLAINPTNATVGSTVTVNASLVSSLADALDSGVSTGLITVTSPGLPTPTTVNVSLNIDKPQLDQASPYLARAGTSGTVILRGSNLSQLFSSSLDLVPVGGGAAVAPTGVTIVSPTEMRLSHPALTSGAWQVRMKDSNGATINRSRARLVVHDLPAFTATTLAYPVSSAAPQIGQLLFDAERNTLWAIINYPSNGFDATQVVRYQWTGSVWTGPELMRTGAAAGMGLSGDGQTLYLSSRPENPGGGYFINDLQLRDPVTFQLRSTLHPAASGTDFRNFAPLNTGDMFTVETSRSLSGGFSLYRLVGRTGAFAAEPGSTFGAPFTTATFSQGILAGSLDGSRVLLSRTGSDGALFDYSASTNAAVYALSPFPPTLFSMQLNRDGSRALLQTQLGDFPIYDRNWQLLGSLPSRQSNTLDVPLVAALAHAGNIAYAYNFSGELWRFNLASPPVNGTYQQDGTAIPLAASPRNPSGANLVAVAMAPEDRTLFIAGDLRIVVVPLP